MDNEKKLLFSLESGLYSEGAPVVITSGRLIGDCVRGGVYAEFTLQNISRLELRSVTLRIQPLRSDGSPLGPAGNFHYFNMAVPRGESFGKDTPIMLPDCYTQSFSVSAINAMFFDGSTWDAGADAKWEPFPEAVRLMQELGDVKLFNKYVKEYSPDGLFKYEEFKDLWRCHCGELNHDGEERCYKCGTERRRLASFDLKKLKGEVEAHSRKMRRLAMIIIPAIAVLTAAGIMLKLHMDKVDEYDGAVALLGRHEYVKAANRFDSLGKFRDSEEQVYGIAVKLLELDMYDEAAEFFTRLGDYEDSAEQVNRVWYTKADDILAGIDKDSVSTALREYDEAYELFSGLGGYSDSAGRAADVQAQAGEYMQDKYDESVKLAKSGDVQTAKGILAVLDEREYKDSAELLDEIHRQEEVLNSIHETYFTDEYDGALVDLVDIEATLDALEDGKYGLLLESDAERYRNLVDTYMPFYGEFELVGSSPIVYNEFHLFDAEPDTSYEFTQYSKGYERYLLEITYHYSGNALRDMSFNCDFGSTDFKGLDTSSDIYDYAIYSITLTDEGNVRITANFEDDYGNEYTQWLEFAKVEE